MCEIPPLQNPGSYPLESLSEGWENVYVGLRKTNGQEVRRYEILEIDTGRLYPQEALNAIAFKCLGLFLFVNSTYFFFYTAVHCVRVFFVPVINLSPFALFKEAWKIVQIPFFYIGMQFAALLGIFRPLEGRALFGKLESFLHDGKTRREAEQYQKTRRTHGELVWNCLCEETPKTAFFVGFCMQPYGRIDDDHIIFVDRRPNLALL